MSRQEAHRQQADHQRLDARHHEDAAAGQELLLGPGEPVVDERADAGLAARLLERGHHDERDEARHGLLEDGDLQVLLRREVREEAALRHADVLGELADGEALEPDLRGERERRAEHRRPRLFALGAGSHDLQNRTVVRKVNPRYARRASVARRWPNREVRSAKIRS